jgi:hypothetical protein
VARAVIRKSPLIRHFPTGVRDQSSMIGIGGTSQAVLNTKTVAMRAFLLFFEKKYHSPFRLYQPDETYDSLTDHLKAVMKDQMLIACIQECWQKFAGYIKDEHLGEKENVRGEDNNL